MSRAQLAKLRGNQQTKQKRQIGQKATLNGKPVVWSGDDWGWQSPATHNELKSAGQFRIGAQEIRRAQKAIANAYETLVPKGVREGISNTVEYQQKANEHYRKESQKSAYGRLALGAEAIQNAPDQLKAQVIDQVSEKTNIARPLVAGVVEVADGRISAGNIKPGRIARAARRAPTPTSRQSRGEGTRQRLGGQRVPRTEQGAIGQVDPDRSSVPARVNPQSPTQRLSPEEFTIERNGRAEVVSAREPGQPPGQANRAARAQARDTSARQKAAKAFEQGVPTNRPIPEQYQDLPYDLKGDQEFETSSVGRKMRISPEDTGQPGNPISDSKRQTELWRAYGPQQQTAPSTTGPEMARLRQEMARLDQQRARNPKVGQQIAPSYENGARIVYQGDSLNVKEVAPGRYRGKDTAEPRNSRKDFLAEGDPDFSGEGPAYGQGYRKDKKKAGRVGDSGAAAPSAPKSLRKALEKEFEETHKRQARRATRAGQRRARSNSAEAKKKAKEREERKADWVNRQLNNIIARHTAENFPNRPAAGNRPQSSVKPGARYQGDIDKLEETKKRSGEISTDTQRSSVRDREAKSTDHRELVNRNDRTNRETWRTARGGRVRSSRNGELGRDDVPSRQISKRLDETRRRQQARQRRQQNQQGSTVDETGRTFDKSIRSEMKGRKASDPRRQQAELARDPQLDADTRARVAETRRPMRRDVGGYVNDEPAAPRARQNNDRRQELSDKQIQLQKEKDRNARKTQITSKAPIDRNRTRRNVKLEGPEYKPPAGYNNEQAKRYQELASRVRRGDGTFATQEEVNRALRDVDRLQVTRTDGLLQSPEGAQAIRDHNARVRQAPGTRRGREFKGMPLPEEMVDPTRREMPNIAKPREGSNYDASTYGPAGNSSFRFNGELKGVETKVKRNKQTGRTKGAEREAKATLKRREARRRSGEKPTQRGANDAEMARIRERRRQRRRR